MSVRWPIRNGRAVWSVVLALAMLGAWEAIGRTMGHGVLPPPSAIVAQIRADRALFALHARATLFRALAGFALGAAVAVPTALAFCLVPLADRLCREVNIAIFAMPPIIMGPLLVLVFDGDTPQILLAGLMVYFPCMAAFLNGLRNADPTLAQVIEAYGGGRFAVLRLMRLRAAVPALIAGLRASIPLALLGAVLGEFGSGAQWGLGAFLLTALAQANPARLWGIGLTMAAFSMAGYGLLAWPAHHFHATTQPVTLSPAPPPPDMGRRAPVWVRRGGVAVLSALLPLVLWWAAIRLAGLSPIIAPGPLHVLHSLTDAPGAADMRAALMAALRQTLPLAALGLGCGLAVAFGLACLSVLAPLVARVMLPAAIVAQNMPVIALIPFIVMIAGRGTAASLLIAVLVTFFPAYVILEHGFSTTPRPALDLVRAYGGGRLRSFLLVHLPYAVPHLFTAMKLAMPQALLGVMVAEWLLTGTGLGNLMNEARGTLDEDTVWAGATTAVAIPILIYHLLSAIEARVRSHNA